MYSFFNIICLSRCFICVKLVYCVPIQMEKSNRKKSGMELSRILKNFRTEYCRNLQNILEWNTVGLCRRFMKVLILGDCSRILYLEICIKSLCTITKIENLFEHLCEFYLCESTSEDWENSE